MLDVVSELTVDDVATNLIGVAQAQNEHHAEYWNILGVSAKEC